MKEHKGWLVVFCAGCVINIIFGIIFVCTGLYNLASNSASLFVVNSLYALYALLLIKGIIKDD